MTADPDLPENILAAVKVLRELRQKPLLTREDRENLSRAKLRIAYYACRSENIAATRENLTYVLGPDAEGIMKAYDRYLAQEAERQTEKPGKGRRDQGEFWGGS